MDLIDTGQLANQFQRRSLEQCFELLRERKPSLALLIQNALMEADSNYGDALLTLEMDEETVNRMVEQLAEIGEIAAADDSFSQQELIAIRSVLMDWMVYAQSFIAD